MSEIITDTITGKSTATTITIGSTPVVSVNANTMTIRGEGTAQTSIQQGLAKVWASYPGAAGSINDSFNVSSLTDIDVGNSQINFSNNMSNSYYSVHTTQQLAASGGTGIFYGNVYNYATTNCGMSHFENGSVVDPTRYHGTITGDLA
jgi:hypothetical protein